MLCVDEMHALFLLYCVYCARDGRIGRRKDGRKER